MKLFHRIGPGGEDSALVRTALVDKGLADDIEFCNIAFETHMRELRSTTGGEIVPVLLPDDGRPALIGKDAILAEINHSFGKGSK